MQRSRTRVVARSLIACVLIAFSSIALLHLVLSPQNARAATAPVKIMPLGDSITGSPGCWRALLWNNLQNTGYTNIDFVGTLPPQGCGIPYDGDNEGHGGYLATNIANQNQLPGWLSATNPDIVMMHLGTNDVWSHLATSTILAAFSTLVDQMRANNPRMKILVAQIIPMNPSTCSDCAQGVINLNAAIPAWASSKTTAQSPIVVVDQWTGFNDATDTYDGVHPNDSGNQKMASKWYPPLTAQLNTLLTPVPVTSTPVGTTPTPTRAVTPTPTQAVTPTPTPSSGATCRVSYSANSWPGGFTANITITNTGTTTINGWTLRFTFAGNQQVTQGWNGVFSQSGTQVTITNASYNATIAPNGSANPGFNGSWSGSNPNPTAFTLNGSACSIG